MLEEVELSIQQKISKKLHPFKKKRFSKEYTSQSHSSPFNEVKKSSSSLLSVPINEIKKKKLKKKISSFRNQKEEKNQNKSEFSNYSKSISPTPRRPSIVKFALEKKSLINRKKPYRASSKKSSNEENSNLPTIKENENTIRESEHEVLITEICKKKKRNSKSLREGSKLSIFLKKMEEGSFIQSGEDEQLSEWKETDLAKNILSPDDEFMPSQLKKDIYSLDSQKKTMFYLNNKFS